MDFPDAGKRTPVEQTLRAALNILGDFDAEKVQLQRRQRAVLNILEDFGGEKVKVEAANRLLEAAALEMREREASLIRSEVRFHTLLEAAPDALLGVNPEGRIVLANAQAQSLFGFSHEELLGLTVEALVPAVVRAHHAEHRASFHADPHARPMGAGLELKAVRKDGDDFPVEISLSPLETDEGPVVIAAIRDVTARRVAEERIHRLNQELEGRVAELAASNRELESLSYSISHDLRAPLRQVHGFAKIVSEKYGPQLDPQGQSYLKRVEDGAQQMGRLIDDLLDLSRLERRELRRQPIWLSELVQEVCAALIPESSGRQVEWRLQLLPQADCDPGLLKQVFANLLGNALKYTRPRERAVIEVGQSAPNGEQVIFVRDNGVGFNMKYADKLFGVFQRLHRTDEFEGTGVGLATVQRIVHKHGGRIWAEGEVGRGATFSFTLGSSGTEPSAEQTIEEAAT